MKTMRDALLEATKVCGFQPEAEALLKIANILEGRSKEEACSIMAAVSAILGFYAESQCFAAGALRYREAELEELAAAEAST